jgi:hypothetical protein
LSSADQLGRNSATSRARNGRSLRWPARRPYVVAE